MSGATLIYRDVSPGAVECAALQGVNSAAYADVSLLLRDDVVYVNEQTCEQNGHVLDGTFGCFDAANPHGLWSAEVCNENGYFARAPVLEVAFSSPQSSVGLTFTFDELGHSYATEMHIAWYRNGEVLAEAAFEPTGTVYTAARAVKNYDRVVVTFYRMNRRYSLLRVTGLMFGLVRRFGPDDFVRGGCEVYRGCDASARRQIIDSARFELVCDNDVPFLFTKSQTLELWWQGALFGVYGLESGRVRRGVEHSLVEIEGVAALGVVDMSSTFDGGVYFAVKAKDLIAEIMQDSPYILDKNLENEPIWGWIRRGSRRDAMTQVCFALGAVCVSLADGTTAIRPVGSKATLLDINRLYRNGYVTYEPVSTAVELTVHTITPYNDVGYATLFNEVLDGELVVTFSRPYFALTCGNGKIVEQSANHARIKGYGGTETKLSGMAYSHVTAVMRLDNEAAVGHSEKVLAVDNMTLVSDYNARACAERLLKTAARDSRYDGDVVYNGESAGDRVIVQGVDGVVESLALTLGVKGIRATVSVAGHEAVGVTHDELRSATHEVLGEGSHGDAAWVARMDTF